MAEKEQQEITLNLCTQLDQILGKDINREEVIIVTNESTTVSFFEPTTRRLLGTQQSIKITAIGEPTIEQLKQNINQTSKGNGELLSLYVQEHTELKGITFDVKTLALKVGDKAVVTACPSPANASINGLHWTTTDASVLKVQELENNQVSIECIGAGTAEVVATVAEINASVSVTATNDSGTGENGGDGDTGENGGDDGSEKQVVTSVNLGDSSTNKKSEDLTVGSNPRTVTIYNQAGEMVKATSGYAIDEIIIPSGNDDILVTKRTGSVFNEISLSVGQNPAPEDQGIYKNVDITVKGSVDGTPVNDLVLSVKAISSKSDETASPSNLTFFETEANKASFDGTKIADGASGISKRLYLSSTAHDMSEADAYAITNLSSNKPDGVEIVMYGKSGEECAIDVTYNPPSGVDRTQSVTNDVVIQGQFKDGTQADALTLSITTFGSPA